MRIISGLIFGLCVVLLIRLFFVRKKGWIHLQKWIICLEIFGLIFGVGASLITFLGPFASNNQNGSDKNLPFYPKSPLQLKQEAVLYEYPVPRRLGNDVLVPRIILQTIPEFDEKKTVYAATYKNNWLRRGNKYQTIAALQSTIMKQEGEEWRAVGLAGTRFHPVQLKDTNLPEKFSVKNISWAIFENLKSVYANWDKFEKEFIDPGPPGSCLFVR